MMMQAHAIATRPSAAGGHDHRSTSSPLAGGVVAATQALGKRKHAVEDCASPRKCLALPAPGTLQNTVHAKHRTADCTLTHHHQESAHSAPSHDRRRRSSSSGDEPSSATALDCDLMQRPSITTTNAANAANAAATAAAAAALDPPTMADSCLSTRSDAAGPGPSAGARDRAGAAAGGGGSAGVAARAAATAGDAPCHAVGGCTDDDVAQRRLERMEVVVEELVGQVHQLQRELREQREAGQQMARALHSANTASASGEASSLRGTTTPCAAPTSPTRRQQGQEGHHSAWVEEQLRAAAEECVASVKSQLRAFAERAISGLQQQVQAQCGAASKYVTSASTLCERLEGVRMAAEQQCAALQGYVAEITGAVRSGSSNGNGNGNAAASRASPAAGAGVRPGSTHSSPTATKAGAQVKPASPGRTSPSGASAHKAAAAAAVNASASAPSSTTAAARNQPATAASASAPGFNSSAQAARPAPGAAGAPSVLKPSSPVPQASARPHTSSALTSATLASAPQASHASTYSNAASLSPVLPLFTASAVPGMHGASASSLSVGMGDTYQLSDGALLLLARVALGAPAPVNV